MVEIRLTEEGTPIPIRTGPKSYSFGAMSRLLEACEVQNEGCDGHQASDENDDMEAFLNECDEAEDEEFDWDDAGNDETAGGDDEDEVKAQIATIQTLEGALENARKRYTLNNEGTLHSMVNEPATSPKDFASILIHSEVRAIMFYQLCCLRIRENLSKTTLKDQVDLSLICSETDRERLEKQATELSEAFVKIRFPFIA